jgi:hypothetical protein
MLIPKTVFDAMKIPMKERFNTLLKERLYILNNDGLYFSTQKMQKTQNQKRAQVEPLFLFVIQYFKELETTIKQ